MRYVEWCDLMTCKYNLICFLSIIDIDECHRGFDDCDTTALCQNVVGSFTCVCKAGYIGEGRFCDSKPAIFGYLML